MRMYMVYRDWGYDGEENIDLYACEHAAERRVSQEMEKARHWGGDTRHPFYVKAFDVK